MKITLLVKLLKTNRLTTRDYTKLNLILLFLFTIFTSQISFSQSIKGTVIDEEKNPLEFVSVALLQPKDSLLVKYTSTGDDGKFELKEIKEGTYLFQIYLMTYQADQRIINITKKEFDLGSIELKKEINQLDEVVINAIIPIKIKQDTVVFNTKAFKVKQDDNVEDLLRKLPGVEISTDGTVNAQGEDITKILVDGKEFFNNDMTIALKNLTADAIKSVEIIDEKSDDTRVTGIEDGEKNKIINLVLKEGKKSGYFGKVGAGIGTEERYTSNFDFNRFTKNTQLALFGNLNNINNTGATVWTRSGGRADNSGYLTTGTAGANFNYEIKKDYNFNVDYHYGYSDSEQEETSKRTEFTGETSFSSDSENTSQTISNNHNVNFSLRDRSVEGAYLSFRGNFKKNDLESDSSSSTVYFNENNNEETNSDRNTNSEDDRSNGNLRFSYRKKMNEAGRNLRIESGISFVDNDDMNFQESLNKFNVSDPQNYYESDEKTIRDEKNKELNYNFSVRYMEPIVSHHFVSVSTSLRNENKDEDLNQTKTINDIPVNPFIYQLKYKTKVYDNQIGYVYSKDKFQFYLSGSLETLKQNLALDGNNVIDKKYNNFLPRVTINYEFKQGKNIRLRYYKSTSLPGMNQVTPAINDFNPLYTSVGNTTLTPEESDNFNIRAGSHNFRNATSFFSYLNYSKTNNAIVTKTSIDDNYIRHSTFENYGSRSSFRGMLYFSQKINKLGMRYNVRIRGNVSDYTTIINDDPNKTKSNSISIGLSLGNDNKNKVDLTVGANYDINKTTYSLQDQDRDYFKQNYYTKFDIDITNSFSFNTQFDYSLYTDDNFDSQTVPIWNIAVEYAFLKGKRANLKLQVIDILDKDIGIVRTSSASYFEESFRTNIGTYTMLSFTYSIKPPTGKSTKRGSDGRRRHYRRHN